MRTEHFSLYFSVRYFVQQEGTSTVTPTKKETEEENLNCLQWETKLAEARLRLANEGPELGKDTRDLVKKASEKLDQHLGCYVM